MNYGTSNADGTPADPDRMEWANADDDMEWQQQCEERAYQHMDSCDERWRSWLLDPVIGPDGGTVAQLLSLYLKADDATADDKVTIAALSMQLRKDYIDFLVNHD